MHILLLASNVGNIGPHSGRDSWHSSCNTHSMELFIIPFLFQIKVCLSKSWQNDFIDRKEGERTRERERERERERKENEREREVVGKDICTVCVRIGHPNSVSKNTQFFITRNKKKTCMALRVLHFQPHVCLFVFL